MKFDENVLVHFTWLRFVSSFWRLVAALSQKSVVLLPLQWKRCLLLYVYRVVQLTI